MIKLISFGYLHGPAPKADRTEDVRDRLRDPAVDPAILDLEGADTRVREVVMATPGARPLANNMVEYAALQVPRVTLTMAVGCAGGKHRGAALVEELAEELEELGYDVQVEHRDMHRPRVISERPAPRWLPDYPPETTIFPGFP